MKVEYLRRCEGGIRLEATLSEEDYKRIQGRSLDTMQNGIWVGEGTDTIIDAMGLGCKIEKEQVVS
jgi:hypothetical protein